VGQVYLLEFVTEYIIVWGWCCNAYHTGILTSNWCMGAAKEMEVWHIVDKGCRSDAQWGRQPTGHGWHKKSEHPASFRDLNILYVLHRVDRLTLSESWERSVHHNKNSLEVLSPLIPPLQYVVLLPLKLSFFCFPRSMIKIWHNISRIVLFLPFPRRLSQLSFPLLKVCGGLWSIAAIY
jgi:hypothetical protein